MDERDICGDLPNFLESRPPVRRAAYSDRTAWLMAVFSELAYMRFDEEQQNSLQSLAGELVNLTGQKEIVDKLKVFETTFARHDGSSAGNNDRLRVILKLGGFDLKGVLFDAETDTQGFVAVRRDREHLNMAVVAFRGTESAKFRDWMRTLDNRQVRVRNPTTGEDSGNAHQGFNRAYKSIEGQLLNLLESEEDLPLYITGHSLGGALATLAAWHLPGKSLAACYTFGAPRSGDRGLADQFRTPVYRIVNGADPVPMIPPSDRAVKAVKHVVRFIGMFVFKEFFDKIANLLTRGQGFQHYGSQRYLSMCPEGKMLSHGPSYPGLRNEHGVGSLDRMWRFAHRWVDGGEIKRIDKYHDIAIYRAKLRAYAQHRVRRELA